MLTSDHDVGVDARYLGNAIVVASFVLGKRANVEECYPRMASKFWESHGCRLQLSSLLGA